jgi:hypothetical protein
MAFRATPSADVDPMPRYFFDVADGHRLFDSFHKRPGGTKLSKWCSLWDNHPFEER